MRKLGRPGTDIAPLVVGGNVLSRTIDEKPSINELDAFIDQGPSAIDTADVSSAWTAGNRSDESEPVARRWLKARPPLRDTTRPKRQPRSRSLDRVRYLDIRQRTEPQITWPRNSVGEYTTIAELMSEATATDRPRGAIAFAIQADIWIRYAVIAVRRYLIRFGPSLASGVSVSRSQFGATDE